MIRRLYILDTNGNIHESSGLQWSTWFAHFPDEYRIVGDDIVNGVRVSTVFVGVDLAVDEKSPPQVWETMIFLTSGGKSYKYSSLEAAKNGHEHVIKMLRQAKKIADVLGDKFWNDIQT